MTTKDQHQEHRIFRRAIFNLEDNIIGIISIPGVHEKALSTNILNLSEGGIQFTIAKGNAKQIRSGDRLVLLQIKAPATLKFLMNIDAEIKWILTDDIFDHAGAGCQFINISPTSREQIAGFVEAWTESREK